MKKKFIAISVTFLFVIVWSSFVWNTSNKVQLNSDSMPRKHITFTEGLNTPLRPAIYFPDENIIIK